jgi:hypothetical protein
MTPRVPEDFLTQLSYLDRGIAERWTKTADSKNRQQDRNGTASMPILTADQVDAIIGPMRDRPISERECLAFGWLVAAMAFTPDGLERLNILAIELDLGSHALNNISAFIATAILARKSDRPQ